MATWLSGEAAGCNPSYAGSNPAVASNQTNEKRVCILNLSDALKYIEAHVPGTIVHDIESAKKIVAAAKDEFARAASELTALEAQRTQLEAYLDTVKGNVDSAEATLSKLTSGLSLPPAAPVAPVPIAQVAPLAPEPGVQTTTK